MSIVFIDRDGVINKDPGGWTEYSYVTRWEEFHFIPGALDALKLLKENNVDVIVISNQAGVGKGHFTKKDLDTVNKNMLKAVTAAGGRIKDVFYCIHRKEDNCSCRKPNTGLFENAVKKHSIDTKGAYFIGDSIVDVGAGKKMGLVTIFVLSGKTSREEMESWQEKPDHVFKDLLEAVKYIIKEKK